VENLDDDLLIFSGNKPSADLAEVKWRAFITKITWSIF
jgi:hypothetical protein